jgi:NAD(P)-dependent dehydrogenase (short-subunit alcohol dehydrogenase family)
MDSNRALIIGAGSAIAAALAEELIADRQIQQIVCVSRVPNLRLAADQGDRLQWLQCDYSEASIQRVCNRLQEFRGSFSRVFICNGLLHDDNVKPEKRLEELDDESLHHVFQASAVVPVLWLKNLCTLLKGASETRVAVFSARVGSIEDNRLGGWYSYRASKAALNMLVRTAAVEYRRRAPNVRFMVFHPGTTDTPLSKPFQQNVPVDKLFQPGFVARRLLELMSSETCLEEAVFLDWAGETIAW